MSSMSEDDLRWLGGFLSGRGSMTLRRVGGYRYVGLVLHMTLEGTLAEARRIIGTPGTDKGHIPPTTARWGVPQGRTAAHRVEYLGSYITEFLRLVLPYMRGDRATKLSSILAEIDQHGVPHRPFKAGKAPPDRLQP